MSNIKNILRQNPKHSTILESAGKLGSKLNLPTFVVGGYVRDCLMNLQSKDIDIIVEGDGIDFAHAFAQSLGIKKVIVYEKFGTAFIPHPDVKIEIASTRKESYSINSRKPKVVKTNINIDLSRRDFTINAIAVSILPDTFGDIIDPFGGISDMKKQILITPLEPNETFSDDPLRMLRAVRFSAQLNFKIENQVLNSIKKQSSRMNIVSQERITEEIIKSLKTDTPSIAFYHLKNTGLLKFVFPEMDVMSGVEVINNKGHKDVFIHTLQVVDNAANLTSKMEIRFAALVHDIAKPKTKRFSPKKGWTFHGHDEIGRRMMKKVALRMKLPNNLRDYLMTMTKLHLRPIALAKKEISDSAIRRVMVAAGEHIDDLMILCRADITTKNPTKVKKYIANFDKVESLMQDVKLRDEMRAFQSPVRGEIIMKTLKLSPGKEVGIVKKAIENAILDGQINNDYESAFSFMIENKNKLLKNIK